MNAGIKLCVSWILEFFDILIFFDFKILYLYGSQH